MRIVLLLPTLVVGIVLASATDALASSHLGVSSSESWFLSWLPTDIALFMAAIVDNVVHAGIHMSMTVQAFTSDPAGALLTLDLIGANCFAVNPPWVHTLFADGISAAATTFTTMAIMALLAVLALALIARRFAPAQRMNDISIARAN